MNLNGFGFLFGLMIVPSLFMLFPEVYFNKRLIIPFYIIALLLAIAGLTMPSDANTMVIKVNLNLFLLCPLYSLIILRTGIYIFNKKLKRNPKIPTRNYAMEYDGIGWDRLFLFVFMTLSLLLPIFILIRFSY